MAGNWFANGKLQGFARESDGAFVSFAAAAVVWPKDELLRYLFVPEARREIDRVIFAPGAIEAAIGQYGFPVDQLRVNALCERAMTADAALVAAAQAEMDARDRAELEPMFPCSDCIRVGLGKS